MKDGTKKVSVTLVNSGTSQAKEVFITARESELVKVVGGKSQYIGYLNSDDLQIVTFKVITKGQTYMDLIVDYANTYNENQKEIVSSIELGKSKKVLLFLVSSYY